MVSISGVVNGEMVSISYEGGQKSKIKMVYMDTNEHSEFGGSFAKHHLAFKILGINSQGFASTSYNIQSIRCSINIWDQARSWARRMCWRTPIFASSRAQNSPCCQHTRPGRHFSQPLSSKVSFTIAQDVHCRCPPNHRLTQVGWPIDAGR